MRPTESPVELSDGVPTVPTAVGKLGSPCVAFVRSGFSRSGRAIGGARACRGAFRRCDQVNLGLFGLTSPGAGLVGLHLPGSPAAFSRVREKLGG